MDEKSGVALVAAVALAALHVLSGELRFLGGVPRSRWLSAFGGVSVAYVFVHLLPELAEGQEAVEGDGALLGFLEDHVYVMALAGLALFYGIENHSRQSRRHQRQATGKDETEQAVFWLSIGSFGVYNGIVGYLLLRGELDDVTALALYSVALGLHFVVNDFALREHHKDAYEHTGRWLIAAAVLAGWALGIVTEIPERAIALILAFIAGGVILNVLKEELPDERRARLMPFMAGAVVYAILVQTI